MTNRPFFRPTDASFKKAVGVVSGNKAAGSKINNIEDSEDPEENKNLKQVKGTIIRINLNKVQADGWECKGTDGQKYNCSISAEVYTIPEGTKQKGYLYPNKTVNVTITINPIKRKNIITEIDGGFSDISNWIEANTITVGHEDAAVQVKADEAKIASQTTDGKEASISSNSGTILVSDSSNNYETQTLQAFVTTNMSDYIEEEKDATVYQHCPNIIIEKTYNTCNLTISDTEFDVKREGQIICHLYNESLWPMTTKSFRALTNDQLNIDIIRITSDGDIILFTTGQEGKRTFYTSITWMTSTYTTKNTTSFTGSSTCKCGCSTAISNSTAVIDYCPICNKWGHIIVQNNKLYCTSCKNSFCGLCGRNEIDTCSKNRKLKGVETNITTQGDKTCTCCYETGYGKIYANYCPSCKNWNTLKVQQNKNNKEEVICQSCQNTYCGSCGGITTKDTDCTKTKLIYLNKY